MKIYAVQEKFHRCDDTVTLFKNIKKAYEFINKRMNSPFHPELFLKEFEFIDGKAWENEIELPF